MSALTPAETAAAEAAGRAAGMIARVVTVAAQREGEAREAFMRGMIEALHDPALDETVAQVVRSVEVRGIPGLLRDP